MRTDTTAAGTPNDGSTWAVTPSGIGAVRVGMSGDELRQAAGDFAPPSATGCAYVRPASLPPGASVMLSSGVVARVDVDSAGIRTDAGVAVGDSTAAVMRAYDGRVSTTPHKYVTGGQYLTVRPAAPGENYFCSLEKRWDRQPSTGRSELFP